jgi:acetyl esterase
MAPEHRFPVAPEDCYAATCWVAQNATRLGLDANRLAVCGDSAGGNLATVVAMMARDRQGPHIVYQLLIYPVTDAVTDTVGAFPSRVENSKGYLLTSAAMDWFFGHYFAAQSDAENVYASPLRGNLSGLPPATVITAGFDPLRDEGNAYALALRQAGVAVEHLPNPTMIHGFMWLMGAIGHTRSVYDLAGSHLRRAFATTSK